MAGPDTEPPVPRRLIGPFTARQLGAVAAVVVVAALVLVVVTRPIAAGPAGATPIPVQTAQIVGQVTEGLHVGDFAPELAVKGADGSPAPLLDLSGNPVTLAALRGKVVWLNFWASWCPPCQGETPVLRDMDQQYRARGLAIVGVAVQETTPDDVKAYAAKYALAYTIAFDATADVFNRYKVYALPTQVFVGPDGRVLEVVDGPLTDDTAGSRIQGWLPQPSAAPASAAP